MASGSALIGRLAGLTQTVLRSRLVRYGFVVVALAFGVLETLAGLMPSYWSFLLLLIPTGLALVLYTTAANSSVQLGTKPRMRGRVMGVYMLVFLGGAPIGSPLIGWIAEQFGPRMSLISGGVVSVIAVVAVGLVLSRVTGTTVRDGLRPLSQLRPRRLVGPVPEADHEAAA